MQGLRLQGFQWQHCLLSIISPKVPVGWRDQRERRKSVELFWWTDGNRFNWLTDFLRTIVTGVMKLPRCNDVLFKRGSLFVSIKGSLNSFKTPKCRKCIDSNENKLPNLPKQSIHANGNWEHTREKLCMERLAGAFLFKSKFHDCLLKISAISS